MPKNITAKAMSVFSYDEDLLNVGKQKLVYQNKESLSIS